jgi:hypothetical protein
MARISLAAFAASEMPAVPIAIRSAPWAASVVALSSSKNVIAVPPRPPAVVGISIVNEASFPSDSTPVVSMQLTAVAAVAVAIPMETATSPSSAVVPAPVSEPSTRASHKSCRPSLCHQSR